MARTKYTLVCGNAACGKAFESLKRDRKYCSLKCYAATPEFKARRDAALVAARANLKPRAKAGEERPCLQCGRVMALTKTDIARNKKTCSRTCYRLYLADRFDRAIASPVTYRGMFGYDEFLSQDKLPCLVEGCGWVGDNLSLHMNQTHGVSEADFKRAAGFNLGTGVVSAAMAANLRARGNAGNPDSLDQPRATAVAGRNSYVSSECIEHLRKGALLRSRVASGVIKSEACIHSLVVRPNSPHVRDQDSPAETPPGTAENPVKSQPV